jgi:hypothetical protein
MAKKLVKVMIDLEYSEDVSEFSSTTSALNEFVDIINAGAAENSFNVVYIPRSAAIDALFELTAQ